ncbi:hypothetical protein BZA77DRAFT_316590 [Pyronema omphalodes]|nr:hypothetical protein BZA77DRAFT_316590 [Pyronema omphalodes]
MTTPWHPSNNLTHLQTTLAPPWVTEPNFRGTLSLLNSSIFTLGLCVYKALHMNIPPANEGRLEFYGRKTKWVLCALLAPEAVLYAAWIQWFNARWLWRKFSSDSGDAGDAGGARSSGEKEYVTLGQGFYVAMGGVVMDIPLISSEIADGIEEGVGHVKRITLGTEEVDTLLLNGYRGFIPSDDEIRDKSKADILAKGLILFQVLWMVVQATARKLGGYPLTILEVHTLIHVACAFLLYLLWFQKPLDVSAPTIISGAEAKTIHNFLYGVSGSFRHTLELRTYIRNVDEVHGFGFLRETLGFMTVCGLYGGLHMTTWNYHFPSEMEKMVWRIACVLMVIGTIAAVLARSLLSECIWKYRREGGKYGKAPMIKIAVELYKESGCIGRAKWIWTFMMVGIMIAARVVITVESFVSLRAAPAGVYRTVSWADAIPHF